MRILILHNFYKERGGEDIVVASESALLKAGGHDAHVETVSNDDIKRIPEKLRVFANAPSDPARRNWMRVLIEQYQPDIVHVHNFFPLLTPAVHATAAGAGTAVVQTLHNYRLICAGAMLLRGDKLCEQCVGASKTWGVVHRCYRGSLLGSLAVVRMQAHAARHDSWRRHVHRFIALTEFAKAKFVDGGLPVERIVVKPNFVASACAPRARERRGVLYVGRLSREKGIDVLVRAWMDLPKIPLIIVGDGPERARLEAAAPSHVCFLGYRQPKEVRTLMAEAAALVTPSVWYEGFPMTIVEAFAAGLPVIASRLGAMAEVISHEQNGLHFTPGDVLDLAGTVRHAFAESERLPQMGRAARRTYERLYTPERNLALLEKIYAEAIEEAQRSILCHA